jgi:AAA15 family ATPase/GTPase
MNEHFIRNIEIKNFKLFKDFKAEGFGRVNLIGGKNNVGKTAFMEACYLTRKEEGRNTLGKVFSSLVKIVYLRNKNINEDIFDNIFDSLSGMKYFIKSNTSLINSESLIEYEEGNVKHFGKFISIQGIKFDKNNYPRTENLSIINFVPSDSINNQTMKVIFDKIKEYRKRELLNSYISDFDINILEFDFIEDVPKVFNKNMDKFVDMYEMGHGLKRYITIISSLIINKNGYLFLDEIENGIHYSNLDKLWEIILTVSKEQNVQVFATTHSKECIESYARVAKRLGDVEITFIELGRNKKNEIKAITMDYERFQDEIDNTNEVRGW